jgi:hypothetical protein
MTSEPIGTEDTPAGVGVVLSAARVVNVLDVAGVILIVVAACALSWIAGLACGGVGALIAARAVERHAARVRARAVDVDELGVRRAS